MLVWFELYPLFSHLGARPLKISQAIINLEYENPPKGAACSVAPPLARLQIHLLFAILNQSCSAKYEATAELDTQENQQIASQTPFTLSQISHGLLPVFDRAWLPHALFCTSYPVIRKVAINYIIRYLHI